MRPENQTIKDLPEVHHLTTPESAKPIQPRPIKAVKW